MVFRKKKKDIQELVVGDFVKEKSVTKTRKRCGEVLMILQDSSRDPTVECVEVDPEDLTHLTKGSEGLKSFKTKRSNLKFYTPRRQLFIKKVFEKGDVVSYKKRGFVKFGRIVCFVHPDGLYSKSHEEGYNGKDLLECVEIDKKPGLLQKLDDNGEPKRFQAQGDDCEIIEVITVDAKGDQTTMHRLNLPEETEQ